MLHKDDDSPSNGQRIELHGRDSDEIEAIRKRQSASDFAIASVRLSGFVLDTFALEQHRKFVAGEITEDEMIENGLARYRKTKHHAD